MKKVFLFFAMTLFFIPVFGQYDYFQWKKTLNVGLNGSSISAKSGVAVDEYNRILYIASNQIVSWQYGTILSGAPLARSNSNLVFASYPAGDYVFYIRNDSKIGCISYLYSNPGWVTDNQYAVAETISSGSSIAIADVNQMFYIRSSDNKVCNFWKNTGGSGYGPINTSALPAQPWSNIIYNSASNSIFYIANNSKIAGMQYNFSTSHWDILSLSSETVAINSKIQVTGTSQSYNVFYVRSLDNRVTNYWKNGSGSGYSVLSATSTPAMVGTDIINYAWNQELYIGNDGNVHSLYYDNCGIWNDKLLNNTCSIGTQYPALALSSNGSGYFYSSSTIYTLSPQTATNFVYKQGTQLMLNGSSYNPLLVNYYLPIYSADNGNTFFPGVYTHYDDDWRNGVCSNNSTCKNLLEQQLQDVSNLGFTAIRFNGLDVISNPLDTTDSNLYMSYYNSGSGAIINKLLDATTQNKLFTVIDTVLAMVARHNLKVNFFIGCGGSQSNSRCHNNYTAYLSQFANRYKNSSTIFCYSVLLEPDHNCTIQNKGYICSITNTWYNSIRAVDPNHLVTIGLMSGPSSQRHWDPSILSADFITFHVYPDINNLTDNTYESVRKTVKWISNAMSRVGKPWIIGETGFPGSNETPAISHVGTYTDQYNYGLFMRSEAFSCGASALTWWQYRDVYWPGSDSDPVLYTKYGISGWSNYDNYLGIEASHNLPVVNKMIVANGTNIFSGYHPTVGCGCMYNPANYYNQISPASCIITGKVVDQNNNPIPDAYIWGLQTWSGPTTFTLTKPDGTFTITANFTVNILEASALGFLVNTNWSPICGNTYTFTLTPSSCTGSPHKEGRDISEHPLTIEGSYKIFPNPNNGEFTVDVSHIISNYTIAVYTIYGQLVKSFSSSGSNNMYVSLDLKDATSGIYFVRITSDSVNETQKIVVNR